MAWFLFAGRLMFPGVGLMAVMEGVVETSCLSVIRLGAIWPL